MDQARETEITVVIPVYGSAEILPELVRRLEASLEPAFGAGNFEVVLVHDCGPDNAWQVIEQLASSRPWLAAIDLRKNAGQHNAIMAGLGRANGTFVVTMDDDLQHDPADIPAIVATLKAGADVCYAQFKARQHALWKTLGSRFNDAVAQRLLKKPRGLYLSPFRGIRGEILQDVLVYQGPFVYLDGLILQATSNIATIEVNHYARSDGRSGYSLSKSVSLWLQMATSFSVTPLRFVSFAGTLASATGFLLALLVFVQKMVNPSLAVGWSSLIISVLLLSGMQLMALGAIGEYIGRILLTVNNKPQYIVRRTIGLDRRQG